MSYRAVFLVSAVIGAFTTCMPSEIDLRGRACPCTSNYTCDPTTNRCVDRLQAGTDDAGVDQDGGIAFSDDFSSTTLGAGWLWLNPNDAATFSLSERPGSLVISLPAGTPHDCFHTVECPRMVRPFPNNGRATFTVRLEDTLTTPNQNYGILLFSDPQNFMRFEVNNVRDGGLVAIYYREDGGPAAGPRENTRLPGTAMLRVVRNDATYTFVYSTDGVTWRGGQTITTSMPITQVGLFVINAGASPPTTTGIFDQFSIE